MTNTIKHLPSGDFEVEMVDPELEIYLRHQASVLGIGYHAAKWAWDNMLYDLDREKRKEALAELAAQAQELGMGY